REVSSKLKKFLGASPIEFEQAELVPDKGIVARGRILPTLPLIKDLQIDLVIDGDNVYFSRVFSAGDLKFPGPIHVTNASLEVFAGTQGIGARGDVFFEIDRVGKGKIGGLGSTEEGIAIEGEFEFDTKLFDKAKAKVWYRNEKFGGSGELGIGDGKVTGIR